MLFHEPLQRLIAVSERSWNVYAQAAGAIGVVQPVPLLEPVGEMLNGRVYASGLCRVPYYCLYLSTTDAGRICARPGSSPKSSNARR